MSKIQKIEKKKYRKSKYRCDGNRTQNMEVAKCPMQNIEMVKYRKQNMEHKKRKAITWKAKTKISMHQNAKNVVL